MLKKRSENYVIMSTASKRNYRIIPPAGEFNDIYEYAAYCGHIDALRQRPKSQRFTSSGGSAILSELRECYELGYDTELHTSELYLNSEIELEVFIRSWDDTIGWGELEGVKDGNIKRLDFSYHDLPAAMADHKLEPGSPLAVRYEVATDKITSVRTI